LVSGQLRLWRTRSPTLLYREEIDVDIADLSHESPLDEDEDDPLNADAIGG
jgi:hypothetical protein